MTAILTLARRLQRSHSLLIPPLLRRIIHPSGPPPSLSTLSLAFHRALPLRFQTSQFLHFFSTHNLNDPFEISEHIIHNRDPHEPGFQDLLKRVAHFPSEAEAMAALDESGIEANSNLVYSVIWELREEWRLAFLAFKWGEKWACVAEKGCELMVWVLGNHKKFNIAWCLIRDLHRSSMSTRRAMLIMMDRYAAANDPGKAIWTFHIIEKFRMVPDEEAFHTLLNVLCKHGNIEEAEEFMLVNKKLFPLEIEGFNIILNGWCNISVDVCEAKRVWREISKSCILPNATSYTHMISCFSKVGNLFDSLRLYDEMKKRGWVPGLKVYNSLIYVLTYENCFKESLKVLDKIKEVGLQPDNTTYNAMILPLCEAKKLDEARNILATMIEEGLSPTIETYHAFLEGASLEGTLGILNRIKMAGLGPGKDTFLFLISKFFKSKQPENALKIWEEMKKYEVFADLTHYTVLVEGLARCGQLIKAHEFYGEMVSNGISDDPKLKKILNASMQDKSSKRKQKVKQVKRDNWKTHKCIMVKQKNRKNQMKASLHEST